LPHAYFVEASGLTEVSRHTSLDWLDSLRQNLRQTATRVRDDPRYATRTAQVDRIADHLEAALHRCLQPDREDATLVIGHGDVVGPNFLFAYENDRPVDCKMVDWSHAALSYSTADLGCFLYMGLDQSTRAGRWDELLDRYCGSLSRTFPSATVPTRATLEKGIRERGLYFGVVAMFYKPYLMARHDLGEQIPVDVSPTRILEIGDTYYPEEKVAILKDMIDRDIIGIRETVQIV